MSRLALWLRTFGIDPRRGLNALGGLGRYRRDRRAFLAAMGDGFARGDDFPVLDEWSASSGSPGAYFQQDLHVAKWIHQAAPRRHVDVGSRIDGFIGHLAVFREVEVIDIRPQPAAVPGVTFRQLDVTADLPAEWRGSTDSLSCLHSIEHFGLGRYGDPIDAGGHLRGLARLKDIVAPGGMLYLSTPIGPQRVEFNAHRVFAAATLLGWFAEGWSVERFAVIDDADRLSDSPARTPEAVADHFGCRLGVGIVAARKLA